MRLAAALRVLGVGAVATIALAVTAAPASAATGGTGYSNCITTTTSNTYQQYATAVATAVKASATTTRVSINGTGEGRTYDCSFSGAARSVPTITVRVKYIVDGSRVNCSYGGGTDGSVSISCASDKSRTEVSDTVTCRNVSRCSLSDTGITFTAASGGAIDTVEVEAKVTITGPYGSASAYSYVTPYQR